MRKIWLIPLILVIAVAMVGSIGCTSPDQNPSSQESNPGSSEVLAQSMSNSQQTGIWVNGQGKVSVTPDLAVLNLGIEAQADTVSEARAQAAKAMGKVMKALKDASVAEEDIQTSRFSIYPVREYDRETDEYKLMGFRVTNRVNVKIRELDRTGDIIDSVAEAGGNLTRIQGINFTIEDPTEYQTQAREKAFEAAKSKAEQLAELAGMTLGEPIYITESSGGYHVPRPTRIPAPMKAEKSAPTPISPGEQEITVNVQIRYSIAR